MSVQSLGVHCTTNDFSKSMWWTRCSTESVQRRVLRQVPIIWKRWMSPEENIHDNDGLTQCVSHLPDLWQQHSCETFISTFDGRNPAPPGTCQTIGASQSTKQKRFSPDHPVNFSTGACIKHPPPNPGMICGKHDTSRHPGQRGWLSGGFFLLDWDPGISKYIQ